MPKKISTNYLHGYGLINASKLDQYEEDHPGIKWDNRRLVYKIWDRVPIHAHWLIKNHWETWRIGQDMIWTSHHYQLPWISNVADWCTDHGHKLVIHSPGDSWYDSEDYLIEIYLKGIQS